MAKKRKQADFEALGAQIGRLVAKKNAAYGSSFDNSGDIFKVFYPNGIRPDQYSDMLGMARVLDKMFRIAAKKRAFGESPWRDITGYGLLGSRRDGRASKKK